VLQDFEVDAEGCRQKLSNMTKLVAGSFKKYKAALMAKMNVSGGGKDCQSQPPVMECGLDMALVNKKGVGCKWLLPYARAGLLSDPAFEVNSKAQGDGLGKAVSKPAASKPAGGGASLDEEGDDDGDTLVTSADLAAATPAVVLMGK